ncbi:acyltransferase [Methylobacterium sp. WL9]|uniref:acyltransferase family protein n=1 Tax=Methylobacterium sp. WL9 TaxID=2603898 RepID=UPI0011CB2244|nr:acyltransferase [Methylobacterium sp. WL9]TXN20110.1 acyltransferase [Methylobacterium sp. WL9]
MLAMPDKVDFVDPVLVKRDELVGLTGLRGLCASVVVLGHYNFQDVNTAFDVFHWHNAAVDIFFVLSGFTMFFVHGQERGPLDFSDFMKRRIARLWPLVVVTLALTAPIFFLNLAKKGIVFEPIQIVIDTLRQILMVNSWPLIGSGVEYNGPQWSLSVEFLLYLALFPLLYWLVPLMARIGPVGLAVAAFISMSASVATYIAWFDPNLMDGNSISNPDLALLSLTVRGACGFSAGFFAYRFCRLRTSLQAEARVSDAVSLLALATVLASMFTALPSQILALLAPLIVVCNVAPGSWTYRLLASRTLHLLGLISFSLYLLHVPLVAYAAFLVLAINKYVVPITMDKWLLARVISSLAIVPLSALCYFYFEAPIRSRLYRFLKAPG